MRDDFSHRLALDRIRDGERIDLVADDGEREAIARRLGLVSLDRLDANAALERDGPRVRACGRLRASIEQCCVASGEPVAEHVDEPFELIFLPEREAARADDEIGLAPEDCDVVFYDGAAIDIGSAIVDTLALAMNPYPRSADAEATLRQAGVLTEEQASPFAVLAKLKKGGGEA
jgi:uncharacterized metal-binding protein YceD (DUF177 family)